MLIVFNKYSELNLIIEFNLGDLILAAEGDHNRSQIVARNLSWFRFNYSGFPAGLSLNTELI